MKVINLSEQPSLLNQYLKELRSVETQKDSMRFRRNIERIGEIMAVEISKHLNYAVEQVQTPLAVADIEVPQSKVVLGTLLRAGLPMHQGFLNMTEDFFAKMAEKYPNRVFQGEWNKSIWYNMELKLERCCKINESRL